MSPMDSEKAKTSMIKGQKNYTGQPEKVLGGMRRGSIYGVAGKLGHE
jgi:hypothetical protein